MRSAARPTAFAPAAQAVSTVSTGPLTSNAPPSASAIDCGVHWAASSGLASLPARWARNHSRPDSRPGVARAQHQPPALRRHRVRVDPRRRDGLLGRLQRELVRPVGEAVGPAVVVRRLRHLLDLARDLGAQPLHGDVLHLADRDATVAHVLPERLGVGTLGRHRAQPDHHHSSRHSTTSAKTMMACAIACSSVCESETSTSVRPSARARSATAP